MKRNIQKLSKDISEDIKANILFVCIFVIMAIYYIYKLFNAMPWFDELWSYNIFITQGVIHSLTYWPMPNNHMLFNGLSAVFNVIPNPFLNLRIVSYIAALINISLIYRLIKTYMSKTMACFGVLLYVGMNIVNEFAIQGRGYTLATMFILVAILQLVKISDEKIDNKAIKGSYLIFAISLGLTLFVVPSQTYPVLAVCITGGIVLLMKKQTKRLYKLIIFALLAAILAFMLYTPMFLNHGFYLEVNKSSEVHLISDSRIGRVFGAFALYDTNIFEAIGKGIEHMTSNPYVSSITRHAFFDGYTSWFMEVLTIMKTQLAFSLLIVVTSLIGSIYTFVRKKQDMYFLAVLSLSLIFGSFLFPFIQCVLPYIRIYTHLAIGIMLGNVLFIDMILENIDNKKMKSVFTGIFSILLIVSALLQFRNIDLFNEDKWPMDYTSFNAVMAAKEYEEQASSMICGSEFIDYHARFHICYSGNYDMILNNYPQDNPELMDIVILHTNQLTAEKEPKWPEYFVKDDNLIEFVEKNSILVYENEDYSVFVRESILK